MHAARGLRSVYCVMSQLLFLLSSHTGWSHALAKTRGESVHLPSRCRPRHHSVPNGPPMGPRRASAQKKGPFTHGFRILCLLAARISSWWRHIRCKCLAFMSCPWVCANASCRAQMFSEPAWEDLLPPPLPAPHQKPYTLLISLDDLLVSSTWDVRRFDNASLSL